MEIHKSSFDPANLESLHLVCVEEDLYFSSEESVVRKNSQQLAGCKR